MRFALVSSFVPFVNGGYRNIVDWLAIKLREAGHEVEVVLFPEVDAPDQIFQQMLAIRWMDLSMADRVVCFRPQAHLIRHPHKILWFIHHIRVFYDMWDSEYRGFPDDHKHREIRAALMNADTQAIREAKAVFTNSRVVSDRLMKFNGVPSEVLYPPILQANAFHCQGYNDEIAYICRLEHHKRQHLLIEALAHTRTAVKLRICGTSAGDRYPNELKHLIARHRLQDRVILENRWITEDEKVQILSKCLAAAYLPLDEDSYGYPSIEASHSSKAIVTTTDSGGVLELVNHGENGLICEPTPQDLAKTLDQLYEHRELTQEMGTKAKTKLCTLNISWQHVLDRLIA